MADEGSREGAGADSEIPDEDRGELHLFVDWRLNVGPSTGYDHSPGRVDAQSLRRFEAFAVGDHCGGDGRDHPDDRPPVAKDTDGLIHELSRGRTEAKPVAA